MIPMARAVVVRHVLTAMTHELPLDTFGDTSQSRIVFEGMAERVKHHAPVGNAADPTPVHAPVLTPFGGKPAVLVGTQQRKQAVLLRRLRRRGELDKP